MSPAEQTLLFEHASPDAASLSEALRAFGYSLETALADLVDNSISANATQVSIVFDWNAGAPWIAVVDNGSGMTERQLSLAMRHGSTDPVKARAKSDLGRFGLGLKTASFSQARRLVALSKVEGGDWTARAWDLDHLQVVREWQLLVERVDTYPELAQFLDAPHGTIVLWQNLDRLGGGGDISHRALDTAMRRAEQHLGMIFHRYINKGFTLFLQRGQVKAWDPFLRKNTYTQHVDEDRLPTPRGITEVNSFVLPHPSRMTKAQALSAEGPNGWSAHQGFFIYRNDRLLVSGGWLGLGFRREDACRLARISIDIDNCMDEAWQIDVKKSRATPPESLREDLHRIAKVTRERALQVVRHRGHSVAGRSGEVSFVWQRVANGDTHSYRLSREHPAIAALIAGCSAKVSSAALGLIEETLPRELIAADRLEGEGFAAKEPPCPAPLLGFLPSVYDALLRVHGAVEAAHRLGRVEPYNRYPTAVAEFLRARRA